MMRRRAHRDSRGRIVYILWLLICIAMLIRWRCVFGPPQL
jgi:hypothetical protein